MGLDIIYGFTLLDGSVTTNKLAAGAVTAAKIANGTITTAQIAANGITQTQSVRSTGVIATTSTTLVDLTGITITMTTTGGAVVVELAANDCFTGIGSNNIFALLEDGVVIENQVGTPPNTSSPVALSMLSIRTPAAGSHTYKIQAARDAGTNTYNSQVAGAATAVFRVTELKT